MMKSSHASWPAFSAVICVCLLGSCANLKEGRPYDESNHAFISYWPPPKDNKKLRLAVKDLIDMKGTVTTAGSEHNARNRPPATKDAECLRLARQRDVVMVGKTNLTELAVTVAGINEFYGTPVNPLNRTRKRIPGGSSSGSAVAVATNVADVAFGTDTAGSIRVPAACCGILGLKTTFGLVSLKGVMPVSPKHLDTVGPMARNIPNLVKGMSLLQEGFEGRYEKAVARKPEGKDIRVGRLYLTGTDPAIDKAIDAALVAKGFKIVNLGEDFRKLWKEAQEHGQVVAASAVWLSDRDYGDKTGVTARTKATILLGELEHRNSYDKAIAAKPAWQAALRNVFNTVDVIAVPTLQVMPPRFPLLGGSALFEAYIFEVQNTVGVNYAGNPALAIPIPIRGKALPVTSLQLVGPKLGEADLLNAGRILETKRG